MQKLTIKPDRHTNATIKLVGQPADRRIFLAFTTNHVATRRTSSERYTRFPPLARVRPARVDSPRGKKIARRFCTAASKCRCKTSTLLPSLLSFSPRSHLPIRISSHHSSCFPDNPFALREYESVRRNDEGIRIKSYFPRCFAIKRLKYHKTAGAERVSKDSGILHPASSDLSQIVRQ